MKEYYGNYLNIIFSGERITDSSNKTTLLQGCREDINPKEFPKNTGEIVVEDRELYFLMTGDLVWWEWSDYFDNYYEIKNDYGEKVSNHMDNIWKNLKAFINEGLC